MSSKLESKALTNANILYDRKVDRPVRSSFNRWHSNVLPCLLHADRFSQGGLVIPVIRIDHPVSMFVYDEAY